MTGPTDCPFCSMPAERIIDRNEFGFVIRDAYPISPGHTLVIPTRHVRSFFDISELERSALMQLLGIARSQLDSEFSPAGYNGDPNGQVKLPKYWYSKTSLLDRTTTIFAAIHSKNPMKGTDGGLFPALERALQAATKPMDCNDLYEMPAIKKRAASVNRVSDYWATFGSRAALCAFPPRTVGMAARRLEVPVEE